jgi:NAD(P)-dependent dehydrogenase (short-subunit alcohol dehydrogenase family)
MAPNPTYDLSGQVALVTGAGSGMGLATARAFAQAGPIGVKGLGEVVMVGVPGAIANAVYKATGKRISDLPITIEKLL